MKIKIAASFKTALQTLSSFVDDNTNITTTEHIARALATAFTAGNKAIICGNGGSACDAMHFAEEFTGRFRADRRALPAIALADASHITCVGNDYGFDQIFARGVEAYGKPGDVFIGLSTSGNSANVIAAVNKAKQLGLTTVALLGKTGGKLAGECDYELIIPQPTSDRVQEIHMLVLHIIIEAVERIMFPANYQD